MSARRAANNGNRRCSARVALLLLALVGCVDCQGADRERVLSPRVMRVRVEEAESGRPLPGVSVVYVAEVTVNGNPVLGIVPNLDPLMGWRPIPFLRTRTGPDGRAVLSRPAIGVAAEERLAAEVVIVNLAANMTSATLTRLLDAERLACQEEPRLCADYAGPAGAAWVGVRATLEDRREVLLRPLRERRGAIWSCEYVGASAQKWSDGDRMMDVMRGGGCESAFDTEVLIRLPKVSVRESGDRGESR
jgi:hypothetical protein